ncbi:chromosome segregation protein SMC [Paenarthrobacter aurescens]|uniref:chromosome segregation protein SMC n=1 Tax=Paenarthrobacter aurescens TaxID=43663 RepID=UPI001580C172|nr:chromosome segregation protein SMC [Paenarthrobacter aurescens]MDO6143892.1 chromosome segregation protein SMC [Paenarthrobacter aurescens]MDO6147739.1 chromosome segregation protein SMC [Paenarthrobacter aurescens]MDO6158983.1 chromosome segregation protein SMC [Paenarthrobacter aurescens]MDO6162967.1 chromosome segregation protein SMC [Paenarthrobacter aurescens]
MHLKSLTVRGFKSFASATTFDFEPGVTAVVGPNGSGKSNVVDALAWVMGEQGAKTLRGGKMEDVIFAGTSGRPPLGRAHVALTIDNADNALPIEYSEVTISRTLFRTGGSEYAINGAPCRLLDIQELLSDSGLGREMHVIVGQGQLDRVLHATPEDRRGFIEEAAGILKHRRRKEKTVRKLEAMQANLARLGDLTAEIRRQLTPLGKQAEIARRAQTVQFDVRDARARLLADDLVQLTTTLEKDVADEAALKERRQVVEAGLGTGRRRQAVLEQQAAEATPRLNAARDHWYQLSATRERLRSLGSLATERRRLLGSAEAAPDTGRDPEQLERQAARVREEQAALEHDILAKQAALLEATVAKDSAEALAAAEDKRLTAMLRAAADRREGLARLAGQVAAARSRAEAAEAERGRLRESLAAGDERRRKAQSEFTALESQVAGVEDGEESLDADYESANDVLDAVLAEIEELKASEREAVRERDALTARRDALQLGLNRKDGSGSLLTAEGVLGPVSALLSIEPGYEAAIAAALGSASDALVVADAGTAFAAIRRLKEDDAGRAALLLAGYDSRGATPDAALELPAGSQQASEVLTVTDPAAQGVIALLAGTVVVDDLEAAAALLTHHPDLTAVTREGDILTSLTITGGSATAPSLLEVQAAVDDAVARLQEVTARLERGRFALAGAQARRVEAQDRADAALERLHESDARLAAVAERLGNLNSVLRSAVGESERLAASMAKAEANIAEAQLDLEVAAERLAAAQEAPDEEPSTDQRDELAALARAARASETEARLALRTSEEQLGAISNRAASLERAAAAERRAREEAARRAQRRRAQAQRAAAVASAVEQTLRFIDVSVDVAAYERDVAEQQREQLEQELAGVRSGNDALARELAELTDSVHRDEMARTQQRLRIEAAEARSIEELGLSAQQLIADYGPDQPVPLPAGATTDKWAELRAPVDENGDAIIQGIPFVRAEQEKRLKKAERELAALGKVNPLALEEFAALEERHQFLSSQLEDLKSSRKDLLDIIKEVDNRVQQVFTEAFADTSAQFDHVFARLFPGGEGRLVLTDPDDMLTTGIEVEARPAGKKIKRLSLLSGGERSLTAVALLVAIFKARPSPFYVMDEVEAALDDTNLGRLITIFEELRESSQLIVITHQKRTMEVADALYGVTMRGDGVSTVISQRLGAGA